MTRGLIISCVVLAAISAGCQENKKTSANDLLAEAGDTESDGLAAAQTQ